MRLAADREAGPPVRLDARIALGCNLALETCFVTRVVGTLDSGSEADTLAALHGVGQSAQSLDEWLNLHDYQIQLMRKFGGAFEPLQAVARDIVRPFEAGPLLPFVQWYRDATGLGRRLRCVFEDTSLYHELVRELRLRNLDERLLGDHYDEDSIVIDPDTGHFDLLDPARLERHVDALVQRLGQETAPLVRTGAP